MKEQQKLDHLHKQIESEGGHIIHADESRLQVLRHQVGQLDSVKNLDLDQLEELRMTQSIKLKELEQKYF